MDRLTILYIVSGIYIVLGIWAIVEAFQLKIHWSYKLGLVVSSVVLAPLGFGLTMWAKKKNKGKQDPPKKKKPDAKKK